MRKRIKQLAIGKFEYAKPILSFSEESLDFQVIEGKDYSGSIVITCTNHMKIRGVVYSTNPRMECLTPQFEGEEVRIRYQFHSKGLVEGETDKGELVIVCNQCEYSLSFCANITKLYADSSIGQIKNLYDFACLAKENWDEAYQLFYHQNFSNIIKQKEIKEAMVYRGIVSAKPSPQNVEEFLIGIRKKNKVEFKINKKQADFWGIEGSVSDKIEIKKDGWGYLCVNVSTDADFIRLPKTKITLEDFLGSVCTFEYYIEQDKLHAGRNFGKISFSSPYQTLEVLIMATTIKEEEKKAKKIELPALQVKECLVGIMELFQAYRLKRIVTGVWANETIEILDHLHALVPDDPMYVLMKAQALIINRQRQEAEWILSDFKREWIDHKSPIWGYYLYLMTLMEREPTYVDRMTHEIEMIFHENPDSVLLFWVLSFLKEEYFNNNARKLKAIEYWVMKGCTSPYLYLEAYYLIWQDPYLLSKLDAFEIRIIRWAIKNHALTRDISVQIFQVLDMSREFDPIIYDILCAAYEVNPKPENIGSICSYLIKNQKYDYKYHKWYEMGIELELRITNLYEAYVLSMDERKIDPVPKIIQMYFQYDSVLPYKRMAVLYNNIIAAKETEKETYQKYRRAMGKFAMEQAELGHMDDNLAVLYEDMLDLGLVNEDLARSLANIVFTHKMIVFDPKIVRAFVYQRQVKEPQIITIMEQSAYFQLFSNEYVIIFEDAKGARYVSSVPYRLQKLMEPEKYLQKCMEFAPEEIPYIVSSFATKQNYLMFQEEDKKFFPRMLFGDELSPEYKAELAPEIIRYYQTLEYDGMIEEYLAKTDFAELTDSARKYMMDLLVENRMYEHAYDKVNEYGMDQIGSAAKVALASYLIQRNQNEEDEFILKLSEQAFLAGKYNNDILLYLSLYYNGPTDVMRNIWKATKEFDIDNFELSERILVQSMYVDGFLPDIEEMFESYYMSGGRELIVLAFLSYSAHGYFVKGQKVADIVFDIIEARYLNYMELNDACKLGLLKHLSELSSRTDAQFRIQDELLAEYTCRNMNFAFYKKLDKVLVQKYHLYDKVFLEYRTNPQNHVVLHYSRDEDGQNFITEDMNDVYGGIFVKSFVMFFGEMIQYYIAEEYSNQVEVTESNRISNSDVYGDKDESRYNLINQMLISTTLQDESGLYRNMKNYKGFDEVTKEVFKII